MGNSLCACVTAKTNTKAITKPKPKPTPSTLNPETIITEAAPASLNLETILENYVPPHHENCAIAPVFTCEFCCELRPIYDSFSPEGCCHFYCTKCTLRYIVSKLQNNIVNLTCPETACRGELSPLFCKPILPNDVLAWWEKTLCESVIPEKEKFYCPFKDCSALLIRESEEDDNIRESECPICRRLFCAECRVPWHQGISCRRFKKLNKNERETEDIMLMNLAKKNKWKRCPNCHFYVSKSHGCNFMKCRCGHNFIYSWI